jgi:hypothetical protein
MMMKLAWQQHKITIIATCMTLFAVGALFGRTLRLQPGLATVMIQYSHHYTNAYYAAKAGNWELAQYQIKEAKEVQAIGETSRPGHAPGLRRFQSKYLAAVEAAVKAKDFAKFDAAFKAGIEGCNQCHTAEGMPYIRYQLPSVAPSTLLMSAN